MSLFLLLGLVVIILGGKSRDPDMMAPGAVLIMIGCIIGLML